MTENRKKTGCRKAALIGLGVLVLLCTGVGGWYAWDRYTGGVLPPINATTTPAPASRPILLSSTHPPFQLSSPLEGIGFSELVEIVSQPYLPPAPGEDTGHHGVDFAYWRRGAEGSILGKPILAVLPGQVAAVLIDRPPFGNALVIETPLDGLPATWNDFLPPLPQTLPEISPRLICPPTDTVKLLQVPDQSIYLLYAHLNLAPTQAIGQPIETGEMLNQVGNTGYSSAPHLHLEARIGPSGVVLGSLAFYEVATTDQERAHYCLFRLSGIFRSFDPMLLFGGK